MFDQINKNPILWTDGYKLCHKDQYPTNTTWVYETWTPRMSRIEGVSHVVFFGLQGALAEMTQSFNNYFFQKNEDEVVRDYEDAIQHIFATTNPHFAQHHSSDHIRALHRLGYLPIKVKALNEGSLVPVGVPMFTIENTHPQFYWLPGYLETQLSSYIWSPMTSATISNLYKRILIQYAEKTGNISKVETQAGDFSMRGMSSPESAYRTGGGHLLSFNVSATVSVRDYLKKYYRASDGVLIYTPSTEHSVMCSYGENELEAFRHLITEVYPSGNISIVSDTYNLWNVVDTVLPQLKEIIMNRDGKVVIRPDSGDPVDIVCGDSDAKNITIQKGIVERLFELFGGTTNDKGYKELDPHIGVVYGDSITPERAEQICIRLMNKGFASTNIILGVGSYTYQYVTRDTFGFALKGTAEEVNGQFKAIQKRPATDTGNFKKSQKGMVAVVVDNEEYTLIDNLTPQTEKELTIRNLLTDFFIDGNFVRTHTFDEIRDRLNAESRRVYTKKIKNNMEPKIFTITNDNVALYATKIANWIKNLVQENNRKGVVLGMSGGIDCSVVARLCQLAEVPTHLVLMPYGNDMEQSKSYQHAMELIQDFDFSHHIYNIQPATDALLTTNTDFLSEATEQNKTLSAANIRPRVRMTYLYQLAQLSSRFVVGTGNMAERMVGYFTKWGDGACDFNPLAMLTKQEVYTLARYLQVPDSIIRKNPSAGLWEGQTDEDELGITYNQIDTYIQKGTSGDINADKLIEKRSAMSAHKFDQIPIFKG